MNFIRHTHHPSFSASHLPGTPTLGLYQPRTPRAAATRLLPGLRRWPGRFVPSPHDCQPCAPLGRACCRMGSFFGGQTQYTTRRIRVNISYMAASQCPACADSLHMPPQIPQLGSSGGTVGLFKLLITRLDAQPLPGRPSPPHASGTLTPESSTSARRSHGCQGASVDVSLSLKK